VRVIETFFDCNPRYSPSQWSLSEQSIKAAGGRLGGSVARRFAGEAEEGLRVEFQKIVEKLLVTRNLTRTTQNEELQGEARPENPDKWESTSVRRAETRSQAALEWQVTDAQTPMGLSAGSRRCRSHAVSR
jgi:hypothetical protein